MTKEQYMEYNALFVGVWDLFKKYVVSVGKVSQDVFWEKYVEEEYEFYQKYKSTFAKELLKAPRKELERLCKEEKELS